MWRSPGERGGTEARQVTEMETKRRGDALSRASACTRRPVRRAGPDRSRSSRTHRPLRGCCRARIPAERVPCSPGTVHTHDGEADDPGGPARQKRCDNSLLQNRVSGPGSRSTCGGSPARPGLSFTTHKHSRGSFTIRHPSPRQADGTTGTAEGPAGALPVSTSRGTMPTARASTGIMHGQHADTWRTHGHCQ